jgi:hypothetical protein
MKEKQERRLRPYRTLYRIGKREWVGHSCTLRGAVRASFPKILAQKKLIVQVYSADEVLLVAMLWQRRRGIWAAVHKDVDEHLSENINVTPVQPA